MVFGGMSRTMLEEDIPFHFEFHPDTMRYIPSFQIGVIRCKVGKLRAGYYILNSKGVLLQIDWGVFLSARLCSDRPKGTLVNLKWSLKKDKLRF
jgi:hypothetical protein